jgi:hypothetical protein
VRASVARLPRESSRGAACGVLVRWPVVAAASVAVGAFSVAAPKVAVAAVVLAALLMTVRYRGAAVALAGLVAVAIVVEQASRGALPASLKRADDVIFLAGFLALPAVGERLTASQRRIALVALLLTALSAFAGALGRLPSAEVAVAAAWQDARWLGAVALGVMIGELIPPARRIWWAYRLLLLLNIANVAVFAYHVAYAGVVERRFGIPVASGIFGYPTDGALAATMLLVLLIADRRSPLPRLPQVAVWQGVAVALVGLTVSTRFKPVLALLIVGVLLYLYGRGLPAILIAALAAVVPIIVLAALAWANPTSYPTAPSSVNDVLSHSAPRVAMIDGAATLAGRHFPVGEGLGTFGSGLDAQREQDSIGAAGLGGAYGFRSDEPGADFSFDNFVAHLLGERGYAGLLAWLLSFMTFTYLSFLIGGRCLFPAAAMIATAAFVPLVPAFRAGGAILILFLPAALTLVQSPGSTARTPS